MAAVAVTITDLSDTASGTGTPRTVTVSSGTGDVGPQGPTGQDGATISATPGVPAGSANVGDLYINTTNGDLYRFS